ncbi:lysozyme inhibitor LprI family protein [Serratia rubidaea]|uniref:lysozyme inhibitor LprI family protein n=1 Tax=Serratia rubidaea TaxID=61652 RepID=UPI000773158A|nr:lysozyme inhibitor LprI family protein [Serratia rubidaea]
MKKYLLVLAVLPMFSFAAQSLDELKTDHPSMCQDIKQEDGYYGDMECAGRLLDDSETKLTTRVAQIRAELKKTHAGLYQDAFERDQQSWEAYRKNRCAYVAIEVDEQSNHYAYRIALCSASENYKRLATLKGEPSVS